MVGLSRPIGSTKELITNDELSIAEDNPARRIFRLPSCAPLMDEISAHIERFCVEVLTSMEHDINERNRSNDAEGTSQLGKRLGNQKDVDKQVAVKKKARRSRVSASACST